MVSDACSHCGSNSSAIEGGSLWCTGCGTQLQAQCEWTFTYSLCSNYRKVPVYSRIKRFQAWLKELNEPVIFANFEEILFLYGTIEFSFHPHRGERMYFFNKNCVLSFILEYLCLPLQVPTLKDAHRVEKQVTTMSKLLAELNRHFGEC
jgi:hypothetical protein